MLNEFRNQEATSTNMPDDDRIEEDPSESRDKSSEKGQKKTETVIDSEADRVKTETTPNETPNTVTEPEAQEQGKEPECADGVSGPPRNSRTLQLASDLQPPTRPTPR